MDMDSSLDIGLIGTEIVNGLRKRGLNPSLNVQYTDEGQTVTISFSHPNKPVPIASVVTTLAKERVTATKIVNVEVAKEEPPNYDKELAEKLKKLRLFIAKKEGVTAFVVFWNDTLKRIVIAQPKTDVELLKVKGIGKNKKDKYGAAILAVCRGETVETAYNLFSSEPIKKPNVEIIAKLENESKETDILGNWKPSRELLHYYVKTGKKVSPTCKFGKWCVMRGLDPDKVIKDEYKDLKL